MTLDTAYPSSTSGVPVNSVRLLHGVSVATDQQPSSLDTPLQIEFGPAQNSLSDPIMLDAAGNITFNQAGSYFAVVDFQFGRTGASGTSVMFGRFLFDGVQELNSVQVSIAGASELIPIEFTIELSSIPAGTVATFEIIRDSQGTNFGGLFGGDPTPVGWANASPATVNIHQRMTA